MKILKAKKLIVLGVLLTWSLLAQADFSLDQLPDGLPPARQGSAVGVLGSALHEEKARAFQDALNTLESKIYGLSMLTNRPAVVQAEQVYYVEALVLGLVRDIANDTTVQSPFERDSNLYRAVRLYSSVRHHAERMFDIMIRVIDEAKPGTSGIQLPTETAGGGVEYSPNYRAEHKLTDEEIRVAYNKKLSEFLASGGSLSEVKTLSKEVVPGLSQLTQTEFVELPTGEIKFTTGKAGHILMAEGRTILSAGNLMILKDQAGEVALVVLSNSSGSYKPDMMALDSMAMRVSQVLDVPRDLIVTTKGEPFTSQVVKILLKAAGAPDDETKEKMQEIKVAGQRLYS